MADIYDATIICDHCSKPTDKAILVKNGFKIRAWFCRKCKKEWLHPSDLAAYNAFKRLKERDFRVKLRLVGNSWAISIPKEIIEYEDVTVSKTVQLSLDEPGRLSIFFTSMRKIIK
ncbi:MAG: hypothetical protein KKA65_00945 [Nanoarchaeota archaeon]|nr:hypothetical protein [Nanoarchaeota archaeon]MBU4352729.1 hypothetical protein [Nanoarchaeota archaeon]MBU4456045.1 hypothetical protein [Nanoarchaeota archaeon]MCG2720116.1 hypothetical protein [Nanoarchaeota archaeon]